MGSTHILLILCLSGFSWYQKHFLCPAWDFRVVPWRNGCIFFFFYRVLFKNKNSSSEPYFLTFATLLQYPHFGSVFSWSWFFTKLTFPFLCCLCWKLALRPYVNWTLVDYPLSCCVLSSSITCRNDRSGQAGWSSGPGGRRAKGIVLFAYWIGARIFYATSLTVYGP